MNVPVYNMKGNEVAKFSVDEKSLGGEVNAALLKQAFVMYHANLRQGSSRTKNRTQVEGSTRKIYKQKGTGNARHGDRKANLFKGGGHGHSKTRTREDYRLDMPKKMRRKANRNALLAKLVDGEVKVIDAITFKEPKTLRVPGLHGRHQGRPHGGRRPPDGRQTPPRTPASLGATWTASRSSARTSSTASTCSTTASWSSGRPSSRPGSRARRPRPARWPRSARWAATSRAERLRWPNASECQRHPHSQEAAALREEHLRHERAQAVRVPRRSPGHQDRDQGRRADHLQGARREREHAGPQEQDQDAQVRPP